jgi:nucleotide-binding universal stress UspA family protein
MISILVPLDGSELAEEVLPSVEDLASRLHAEVYFVQAVESRSNGSSGGAAEAERYLSCVVAAWAAKGIDAKWEVLHGAAARSIATFARAKKSSMIAMSTHGRSGLSQLVFGSVANQVLREAGVPVMMVRPVGGPTHQVIRLSEPEGKPVHKDIQPLT